MRYKIKTGSGFPAGGRRSVPQRQAVVLPLRPSPRPYNALELPATPLDAVFSSEPVFERSPAGWYRMGFYA